jgi:hypothetical protein
MKPTATNPIDCSNKIIDPRVLEGSITAYRPDVADKIIGLIYDGYTLTKTLNAIDDAPSLQTLYIWRRDYPEFNQALVWARQSVADRAAEKVLDIAYDTLNDPEGVPAANAKVASDNLKWTASKFDPRTYADRLALAGEISISSRLQQLNNEELDDAIERLQAGMDGTKDDV